ncbi:MAG TPA: efflux transporter outer membrane subunit [Candidatus Aquilonibacter sp.]|nr:efflux transporter outer membrane subunit [Candidatus Aquilonibacter sp.]
MARRLSVLGAAVGVALLSGGCVVGPKYHTPAVQVPPAYKEAAPPAAAPSSASQPSTNAMETAAGTPSSTTQATAATPSTQSNVTPPFRVAQPNDNAIRGDWWAMFNDPELNQLEAQVNVSNQTIAEAMGAYFSARALVREARSEYWPVITADPSMTRERAASTLGQKGSLADFSAPGDASWVPDLWGRLRNTVTANSAAAQISAADLENTRLSMHSELAVDYFELRGEDNLKQLLDSTVVAYQQSLDLTNVLYQTGIDNDESVAQAETQLQSAQAADTNVGILRAQYEHAIAVLVGQPPSTFAIAPLAKQPAPPIIPVAAPSYLLERRPDIAAAERAMAQANAQIGIATAAYYPSVTLTATGGFQSTSIADWFLWSSRIWSIGASLSQTVFDAGLRRATVQQYRGVFDEDVATYRQTVLTAFQQVEDNLSTERILTQEVQQQDAAVASAQRYLTLATERYRLGIDPYLNVITAETTLLTNQQAAVNLRTEEMTSAVDLIEALGGGWDVNQLPSMRAVAQVSTPTATPAAAQPAPANQSNQ